jgi:isopenicillin-N epimerase
VSFKLRTTEAEKVKATLFNDYQIEVPVMRQGNDVYLRYSINAFNTQADLDRLYEALLVIVKSF